MAVVYQPDKVTLYCSSNNTVLSAVDNRNWAAQAFDAVTCIGLDTDVGGSARTFNGSIDDVAIYDHTLNAAQINAIFAAGKGSFAVIPVSLDAEPVAPSPIYLSDSFTLSAAVPDRHRNINGIKTICRFPARQMLAIP